jgi:hypothetical protein
MKRIIVCSLALILSGCATPTHLSTLHSNPRADGQRYWDHVDFPILVRIDSTIDPRYIVATEAAVEHWNSVVGRRFLRSAVFTNTSDVWTVNNCIDVRERDLGGNRRHKRLWGLNTPVITRGGRIRSSLVEWDIGLPDRANEVLFEVAIHEIGHALGLRHDEEDRTSVMHPYIFFSSSQTLQQEDIEAIRQMLPPTLPPYLREAPEDPWPHNPMSVPTVHVPPPCPGMPFSAWLTRAIEEQGPWGPCVGPRVPLRPP